jgi:hypothetical protein
MFGLSGILSLGSYLLCSNDFPLYLIQWGIASCGTIVLLVYQGFQGWLPAGRTLVKDSICS